MSYTDAELYDLGTRLNCIVGPNGEYDSFDRTRVPPISPLRARLVSLALVVTLHFHCLFIRLEYQQRRHLVAGTGKSSIVCALCVGLGGPLKVTERGDNVCTVVKFTCNFASEYQCVIFLAATIGEPHPVACPLHSMQLCI